MKKCFLAKKINSCDLHFAFKKRWVSERVLFCTSKEKQMKNFQQQSQNMKQTNHYAEYFLTYSGTC